MKADYSCNMMVKLYLKVAYITCYRSGTLLLEICFLPDFISEKLSIKYESIDDTNGLFTQWLPAALNMIS